MLYETSLTILHQISQGFLFPAVIVLLVLLLVSVMMIGGLLVEFIMEQRKNRADTAKLAEQMRSKTASELWELISTAALTRSQKRWLKKLSEHLSLPKNSLVGVAEGIVAEAEGYYGRVVGRSDTVIKLAPMVGLLGTLIPLGPGIVALGNGEVELLSIAMLTAFDTTVAGLISAGICLVISAIRKKWYRKNMAQIETLTECMLEEALAHGSTT